MISSFVRVICCLCFVGASPISNPFKSCHKKDQNFSQCLASAIEEAIISLRDGNKDLGVLPLEPISVPKLVIAGKGSVQFDQNYSDIKLGRLTHTTVSKAELDEQKKTIKFTNYLPEAMLDAKYEINGKVLVLPIQGKGNCKITLYNVTADHIIKYEEKQKKGETFFNIVNYDVKIYPKFATFDLDNLFNGNKQLADNTLKVLNDNWEVLTNDVKESYEEWFAQIFIAFAKRIFSKLPAKVIFPD